MGKRTVRSGKCVAAALLGFSALAATGLTYTFRPAAPARRTSLELPARLCHGWTKPDLVLVLSGQQHGYLLPCGCSRPQYGGLERRHNLIQILKDRGWPVTAVDLGDIPQDKGP